MKALFANADVGRKNILFGIALFLILGVVMGIPLTIDFFGGSIFTVEQYQTWKVVHGYSVFLAFINYFFGLLIDQVALTKQQKEISSWFILISGVFGGVTRSALILLSSLHEFGMYASLGEVVFITLGTAIFLRGLLNKQRYQAASGPDMQRMLHPDDSFSSLASDTSSK
jgi:hypothetical protein